MGVGPGAKETTKHYYHDPLLEVVENDSDVNLRGIVIVGCPDVYADKMRSAGRVGTLIAAMGVDGAIFSCNGLGNNHIDYVQSIEETEKRGVPVAALSSVPRDQLVVQNDYLDGVICFYKPKEGRSIGEETDVLCENTVEKIDAEKALALLKLRMRKADNRK
jgi:D-proline reductase (dithiol) PrdE